jgi:hypothetical protein
MLSGTPEVIAMTTPHPQRQGIGVTKDQALTPRQAAAWLCCSETEVQTHLDAGRRNRFGSAYSEDPVRISLNAVVILGESLPTERGVFNIREKPVEFERKPFSSCPRASARPGSEFKRPLIVECRPV